MKTILLRQLQCLSGVDADQPVTVPFGILAAGFAKLVAAFGIADRLLLNSLLHPARGPLRPGTGGISGQLVEPVLVIRC